jgi:hypothetical protein
MTKIYFYYTAVIRQGIQENYGSRKKRNNTISLVIQQHFHFISDY